MINAYNRLIHCNPRKNEKNRISLEKLKKSNLHRLFPPFSSNFPENLKTPKIFSHRDLPKKSFKFRKNHENRKIEFSGKIAGRKNFFLSGKILFTIVVLEPNITTLRVVKFRSASELSFGRINYYIL
jgi:hypothetical protein